jgi:hypothetical protein
VVNSSHAIDLVFMVAPICFLPSNFFVMR